MAKVTADTPLVGRFDNPLQRPFAFGSMALTVDALGLRWTLGAMGFAVALLMALFAVGSRRRPAGTDRLRDLG